MVTQIYLDLVVLFRISIAVTQKLLEHSSPNITNKGYEC